MRYRRRMGLVVLAAATIGGGVGAKAQTDIKPENTPTPPPPTELRKHIEKVRAEPEQVKDVPVDDTGTDIKLPRQVQPGRERVLPPPEPDVARPSTVPEMKGKAKAALLRQPAYKEQLAELSRCRHDVAFDRKVKPAAVLAGGVTLRWTVGSDGQPQDVEVVAAAPTDPDVMSCVHKKLSAWTFTPAPAEPYRMTHRLNFR